MEEDNYFIGFNVLRQFLFGISYFAGSWSLCFGPFAIEIHPCTRKTYTKLVSFYNAFDTEGTTP